MRLEPLSTEIKLLHVSIHCRYISAYTFLSFSSLTTTCIFSNLCWAKNKLSKKTKSGDTCRVLQYKSWPSGLPLGSRADTHIEVCHWKRITLSVCLPFQSVYHTCFLLNLLLYKALILAIYRVFYPTAIRTYSK